MTDFITAVNAANRSYKSNTDSTPCMNAVNSLYVPTDTTNGRALGNALCNRKVLQKLTMIQAANKTIPKLENNLVNIQQEIETVLDQVDRLVSQYDNFLVHQNGLVAHLEQLINAQSNM